VVAQTVANLASVIKDAWTSDRMAKQFYDENPVLDWFSEVNATMMGLQAQVPIQKYRGAGVTSTSAAGGTLNPAVNQQVDQAIYTMPYLWKQISLETGALNQTGNQAQAVIAAKDLEVEGAVSDISKEASRQLVSNGDGLIAQCTTGGASTTINLLAQASGGVGYDAIVRGWLYPGLVVDIGTTADTDVIVTGTSITDVGEDPVTPTITIGSSVSTTSSHFVSIANPNSTTLANPEINGLRNMISLTSTLGGINPASAGESFWKAAAVDTASTSFSLDMALNLHQKVFQKGGTAGSNVLTSVKQWANFYSLLQNQVRFAGETGLGAGGITGLTGLTWAGIGINVYPDIVDKEWYFLTKDDFVRITGNITKPTWTSELEGGGQGLRWSQGTTSFNEGLVFPMNVGAQRRNRSAAATNLIS
jgi:hypothetical protein